MSKLHISKDLALPLEFITQTQAILAKKRVGKSYTASVQAEEYLKAGQQIVVIDPTGAWWGLRSSADGKSKGFPILIAGGEHGDIPLEANAGEVMAGAIVDGGISAIIDLTLFRKSEANRFLATFFETLYRRNRQAMHLFADEADYYAPQKPFGDEARTLGAMDDIVRRGGIRGIGCTLITQRPAVLNKNVLTQCGVLTCLRIVHPKDLDTIREWVEVHDVSDKADEMMKSLPSLPIGTAWMWAPGWPDEAGIFKRIEIRPRETFDSGATPKPGQKVLQPKTLAQVDVEKLGEAIKQTAETAKANDPAALKRRVKEADAKAVYLEKQLAAKTQTAAVKTEIKTVEKPVLKDGQLVRLEKMTARLEAVFEKAAGMCAPIAAEAAELRKVVSRVIGTAADAHNKTHVQQKTYANQKTSDQSNGFPPRMIASPIIRVIKPDHSPIPKQRPGEASADPELGKGERVVMIAVAQNAGCRRDQLTVLTGYKRSSRDTYLQRLSSKGFVDLVGDQISATEAGMAALGSDYQPLPTGSALLEYHLARLGEGERRILSVLTKDANFEPVTRDYLSNATEYKRSSRDTYLQRLSSRRLVEFNAVGMVKAASELAD